MGAERSRRGNGRTRVAAGRHYEWGSYNCRGRNNDASAKISEHGRGNAFDLGPIKLANGAVMDLSNRVTPQSFRLRLRDATCHRFNTVLGPGWIPIMLIISI